MLLKHDTSIDKSFDNDALTKFNDFMIIAKIEIYDRSWSWILIMKWDISLNGKFVQRIQLRIEFV
jgi:hypothetical protein